MVLKTILTAVVAALIGGLIAALLVVIGLSGLTSYQSGSGSATKSGDVTIKQAPAPFTEQRRYGGRFRFLRAQGVQARWSRRGQRGRGLEAGGGRWLRFRAGQERPHRDQPARGRRGERHLRAVRRRFPKGGQGRGPGPFHRRRVAQGGRSEETTCAANARRLGRGRGGGAGGRYREPAERRDQRDERYRQRYRASHKSTEQLHYQQRRADRRRNKPW